MRGGMADCEYLRTLDDPHPSALFSLKPSSISMKEEFSFISMVAAYSTFLS